MPKDPSIQKVLVIGSGPIVIGQAAEFDYAGTQACRALREDGGHEGRAGDYLQNNQKRGVSVTNEKEKNSGSYFSCHDRYYRIFRMRDEGK